MIRLLIRAIAKPLLYRSKGEPFQVLHWVLSMAWFIGSVVALAELEGDHDIIWPVIIGVYLLSPFLMEELIIPGVRAMGKLISSSLAEEPEVKEESPRTYFKLTLFEWVISLLLMPTLMSTYDYPGIDREKAGDRADAPFILVWVLGVLSACGLTGLAFVHSQSWITGVLSAPVIFGLCGFAVDRVWFLLLGLPSLGVSFDFIENIKLRNRERENDQDTTGQEADIRDTTGE